MRQYDDADVYDDDDYCDDDEEWDYCYECTGYGDDYYIDEEGELICRCPECLLNPISYDYWDN